MVEVTRVKEGKSGAPKIVGPTMYRKSPRFTNYTSSYTKIKKAGMEIIVAKGVVARSKGRITDEKAVIQKIKFMSLTRLHGILEGINRQEARIAAWNMTTGKAVGARMNANKEVTLEENK